ALPIWVGSAHGHCVLPHQLIPSRGPAGTVEARGSGRAEAKPAGRRAEAKPAGRRATDPTPGSADARLLLGDAVDPTAAGVEFARIDSDDLPPRVHAFEHGGRLGVHRVVEGARDD